MPHSNPPKDGRGFHEGEIVREEEKGALRAPFCSGENGAGHPQHKKIPPANC